MKASLIMTALALFIALACSGCATTLGMTDLQVKQMHISKHPEWTEQERQDVLAGEPKMGMSKEQAIAAHGFSSRINPTNITKTTTVYGTREDWFWLYGGISLHMSFDENGKLDYWSES